MLIIRTHHGLSLLMIMIMIKNFLCLYFSSLISYYAGFHFPPSVDPVARCCESNMALNVVLNRTGTSGC